MSHFFLKTRRNDNISKRRWFSTVFTTESADAVWVIPLYTIYSHNIGLISPCSLLVFFLIYFVVLKIEFLTNMLTTPSKGRTLCAVEPPSPAPPFYHSQRFSLIFFQLSKQTCFSHHLWWCLTSQDVSCCSKWWIYQKAFHWSLAVTAKTETVILKECT